MPDLSSYHNFFMIIEGRDREYVLTDHLILHFLELPKVEDVEMNSKIARWMLYLKVEGRDSRMLKILLKDDDDLKIAHKKYKTFTSDEKMRSLAMSREKFRRDQLSREGNAREEGLKQGIEKGELEDKRNVLIRLLELKYGLTEDEKKRIRSVSDFKKLDAALDAIVLSDNRQRVLKLLT